MDGSGMHFGEGAPGGTSGEGSEEGHSGLPAMHDTLPETENPTLLRPFRGVEGGLGWIAAVAHGMLHLRLAAFLPLLRAGISIIVKPAEGPVAQRVDRCPPTLPSGSGRRGMIRVESEARKALNRLVRALEKSRREMESLAGAIRHAEGDDFPAEAYRAAEDRMDRLVEFAEEEGRRLQAKILQSGGLEPGRVRRSSS